MDPFQVIDPFLHELILQHFNASEVLKSLSLVSVDWSEIVGKSKKCMNKVRFIYQVWRNQYFTAEEVFTCVQNSSRKYQHVETELEFSDDLKKFWKFIETCSSSLVTLKLENIRKPFDSCEALAEFPNLEVLVAYGLDANALTTILKSTRKLKIIYICSSDLTMDAEVIRSLTLCLQNNPNLQNIYLKNVNFVKIFEKPFEANLQLKSLKLMNTSPQNTISSSIEENLLKFLDQQKSTLETFFFEFENENVLEFMFNNNLPCLVSIGLPNVPTARLQINPRITNLEIPYTDELSEIRKIIDATPNLRKLFVGTVTNELVEHLAWRFMKLEELNFKMIGLEVEEYYEKLKEDHPEVNQNIEIWDHENVDWD